MKFFKPLFYFFIFNAQSFSAQQVIQITFRDKIDNSTIHNVSAAIKLTNKGALDTTLFRKSNEQGSIYFTNTVLNNAIAFSINTTHSVFEDFTKTYAIQSKLDTIRLSVSLVALKVQAINQITVKAPGVTDTVFQSTKISVADYELLENGMYLLLTYERTLAKQSELLLFDGINVLSSFQLPEKALYLTKDYRNNTHIICESNVYGVVFTNNELSIGLIPKEYFFKYIAPIVDSNTTKLYFSNFNKDYPAFDYFTYDLSDSTYRKILHIEDDLIMELYRSEYKWVDVRTKLWAKNKELQTGIDAEIWVGANYFTQSIYYEEVYAPLFQRNDSVFIFDFTKDQLSVFNKLGDSLNLVPIYFHYFKNKTGWKRQIIQDKSTGKIYCLFEKDGNVFLGLISTSTGLITKKYRLHFKYVEEVKIDFGIATYIYRPFESPQKKYLYKEKLLD